MLAIGVDQSLYVVYEGRSFGYGHAVWPSPVLSIATIVRTPADISHVPESSNLETKFIFREDSFDPVTRIRRGRLYHWQDGQSMPSTWYVQPHPAYPRDQFEAANSNGGVVKKNLFGWHSWPAFRELGGPTSRALIALGTKDAYTLWRVVDIERIVTGEDLLTLRARSALGILPELDIAAIPEDGREKVKEIIEKLADAAYRAGPESIADLARSAAQWCLGVWLADKKGKPELRMEDLGALVRRLEDDQLKDMAMLIGRFHSRAKPNERERYASRDVIEADAEFALASIGLLLRELAWAK
jgi:hypothetical protein